MQIHTPFLAGGVLAVLLTATVALTSRAMFSKPIPGDTKTQSASALNGGIPVVVELFTSEGCSSCPPADRVLANLKRTQPIAGTRILVLSEHVDYWNSLGWNDPFSSRAYTARQQAYGRAFHLDSVYTPQAVVDGQAELVGSERENLEQDIRSAARRPKATVEITPMAGNADAVRVTVRDMPQSVRANDADVMLAITQNNLSSHVVRGENAGRTLTHVAVMRSLRSLGKASGRDAFSVTTRLDLPTNASRGDMEAVVFVQDRNTRHILGANALRLVTY